MANMHLYCSFCTCKSLYLRLVSASCLDVCIEYTVSLKRFCRHQTYNETTLSFVLAAPTSTSSTTSVTKEVLSKMDPQQVGKLLKARGMDDDIIRVFVKNAITGEIIVDGLSDDDLKEMSFTSGIQRRGIMGILKLIISNGWFNVFPYLYSDN